MQSIHDLEMLAIKRCTGAYAMYQSENQFSKCWKGYERADDES